MRNKKNNGKKSNGLFLAALVILSIIVIVVFFLFNKDQIFTNLKETDFFGRIFGSTPKMIEKHEVKPKNDEIPLADDLVIDLVEDNYEVYEKPTIEKEEPKKENKSPVEETKKESEKEELKFEEKKEQNEAKQKEVTMTTLELCFLEISNNGLVSRKIVKRSVPKGDSPLTTAINLLLAGPDMTNKAESKLSTLISKKAQLLSARVKDGIAYLNFNEEFGFSENGVDGIIHSLEQVVYTATSFSTVDKVQILIEGKKREFLNEGQYIGVPLSRADF